ncbi:MAG: hypothetical protein JRN37_00830 [Nitrososphaerota archaeon]|jgi:hypothetical protein|nr:hypothetical protein [Nitrososphaerota archaeon]MDG7039947.1 hypothetical protein [Nitrososphaerota archaeon]MDG7042459.1 hypothetical protein [Nitrososphaerota archaeon]MDG7046613.1 hypothetical protein [Nitrososphaerota archaeon]
MDLEEFKAAIEDTKRLVTASAIRAFHRNLINVTLMGSTVNSEYKIINQDLDFLVVIGRLNANDIRAYAMALEDIKGKSKQVRIEWTIKDGPWKPSIDGKPLIAVHMNLETQLAVWRRATHQTNLARSMFLNCETLHGPPLRDLFPILPYTPQKALSDCYAFPWLKGLLFAAVKMKPDSRFELFQYATLSAALNYRLLKGGSEGRIEAAKSMMKNRPRWSGLLSSVLEGRMEVNPRADLRDLRRAIEFIDELEEEIVDKKKN